MIDKLINVKPNSTRFNLVSQTSFKVFLDSQVVNWWQLSDH
jgi:hypothetical protein